MNTIKFYKKNGKSKASLNKKIFTGYLLSELPSTFGFIYDANKDKDGDSKWFNYNGLTYVG